ncbi:hypothetical protein [Salinibacterium sp. NK8237]|uniref:hypothetical protein n=1 Tax=Salinibacterium sp. NK8237 TaxID=2792038 RepID=UPI0018CEC79B|nr:hypothetical protein [Salinibacterium sp. NK8237]MBH0130561.1 hypothetical protein [Salinibacterium sp. NK8237]
MTVDWRRQTNRAEVPIGAGDFPWEWAIAMPYRCLADPEHGLVMPASPDTISDDHQNYDRRFRQNLAYYTALQSFLTYSFGWTRHDKGLLWWFQQGLPTDDPRFALIKDIWFFDETLTGYLAWSFQQMEHLAEQSILPLRSWAKAPDLQPLPVPEEWANKFREALRSSPWTGGSDPMHLWGGHHAGAPSVGGSFGDLNEPLTRAQLFGVDQKNRKTVFVADSINGWYARLAELGAGLPELAGGRSWNIEVFVKPIGFLGSYRRSRETGLWFSGQHRFHSVGN